MGQTPCPVVHTGAQPGSDHCSQTQDTVAALENVHRRVIWLSLLDLLDTELSPERCWRGPRSQEVLGGKGGGLVRLLQSHYQSESDFELRWAAVSDTFSLMESGGWRGEGESQDSISSSHSVLKRKMSRNVAYYNLSPSAYKSSAFAAGPNRLTKSWWLLDI